MNSDCVLVIFDILLIIVIDYSSIIISIVRDNKA